MKELMSLDSDENDAIGPVHDRAKRPLVVQEAALALNDASVDLDRSLSKLTG